MDGAWIAGNLNQLQLGVNGLLSHNGPRMGQDLLISAYQLWMQPTGAPPFVKVGDDLTLTELPFRYLTDRVYVLGTAYYATSQLRQLDHRVMGGASVGYAPVRRSEVLVRAAVGAFYEYSVFPGETFSLDVSHRDGTRSVPRVGLNSNGWYRPANSPASFRYLAWVFVNPLEPIDYRYNLDVSAAWKVVDPVALRLSTLIAGSSVVLDGVSPFDARTTVGVALTWPAPP